MIGLTWDQAAWAALIICLWIVVYLAPSVVAIRRRVPNRWSVVVVNVLLGWTLVGWAVALAMSVRDKPTRAA